MQHPVDGRAWKNFDTKYLDFAKEPRNVRLGLAADGFNPFGNLSQSYNMWPVILITYNLPLWLCMKESSFMLILLIPGPKSPGKDIDVYLRPLIDDLKDLWALKGVETIDVAIGQKFNMRAMVLWAINDFPARSKTAYVGHRRFLKKPHKWRRSLDFNGETEDGDPSRKFDRVQIMAQLARLPTRVKGKHPRELKKNCQFIKGVKLPDGFGSNFKHKVTDNDTNITGLKSHDCHIMMQRLLPYGLQQYLPPAVATPIIELCSFFKQICSQTLMEDDMLKAQSKVVDILCNLELIYPLVFFDIMIHLVIHLPLKALEGGPIRPRWMYPFERYMKKLKNYVRNKAKPEGSIAEGYVAEEALAFSSHYFQDVTTKFNRPNCNVDSPPPTEFPNQDMKEEFPDWFGSQIRQRHIDKDPGCQRKQRVIRFGLWTNTDSNLSQLLRSQRCKLEEILEFSYMSFKVVLFRVKWFDTSNEGQDDHDVIHFDNSSDLTLSTSLNDLDFATLHIDGQSMDVDAPPDIIDVDEDDDIIDEEDALPYDLANSDDEDLINVVDDDDVAMSANVARGHGGEGGGNDCPPSHQIGGDCQGKGTRKPNLGDRKAGWLNTHKETQNLSLRRITDLHGPQQIRFEWSDRGTLMPLDDHAAHWANLLEEIVREFPMHYCSWHIISAEKKVGVLGKIGSQFDLTPHMQSDPENWIKINTAIQQHLAKIYMDNKSALKAEYWIANPEDGTYDVEHIRSQRPANTSQADWDAQIGFWSDPKRTLPGHRCPHFARASMHAHRNVDELKKTNKQLKKQMDMIMKVFRSDDNISQLLMHIQSQPKIGCGGAEDDKPGYDEDADEDEEDEDKSSSTSTTPIVQKTDKIERLIIDGKVTLVVDEGKPLENVNSLGDHDSEDEVELVDNEMTSFISCFKEDFAGTMEGNL
ncbi:hypothetical protein Tco_0811909 [Tanacetum coccineum]